MKEVYFDNAATTKISPEVLAFYTESMASSYANPSSMHHLGFQAEKELKAAAANIAAFLNVGEDEIYFTSGGTLSNNLAIFSTFNARKRTHTRFVTTKLVHPSVAVPILNLGEKGMEIQYIETDQQGCIDLSSLEECLDEKTALVSITYVNNELGNINDVEKIGRIIKGKSNAFFHVDAVQAFGKIPICMENVDMLTISSHKIHGVKGVGGLYINKKAAVKPLILGGGQQRGFLPGTENTNGIAAFAYAAKLAFESIEENYLHAANIKRRLLNCLAEFEGVYQNGCRDNSSPYILNLSFTGVNGETLLNALSQHGIYVSTGSACKSRQGDNILAKMRLPLERYTSAIRFSFSKYNTIEEVDYCCAKLAEIVPALRKYRRK